MLDPNTKFILKDFLHFLRKPSDQQVQLSTIGRISLILKLLVLELLFTVIIVIPLDYLIQEFIHLKTPSLDYKFKTIYSIILLMVLIVPFFEELVFRFVLRYNSFFSKKIRRQTWDRYFPYLVYIMSISFGLVHASNYYNDSFEFFILSPFIILSQLSGGFVLSYIRVRVNFYYGFIYHALWNFIAVLVIPSIILLFTNPVIENTPQYQLKIDENIVYHQKEGSKISFRIENNVVYEIEAQQIYLQEIVNIIYGKEKYYADEYLLDLDFHSEKGVNKEELKKIIEKNYDIEQISDGDEVTVQ